jgi:hypothetical protein
MDKQLGLFKLVNGDEVVAEYGVNEYFYTFKAPRRILLIPAGPSELVKKLIAWMTGNPNGEFTVQAAHIITATDEMQDELKQAYLKEVSPIDLSQATPTSIIT